MGMISRSDALKGLEEVAFVHTLLEVLKPEGLMAASEGYEQHLEANQRVLSRECENCITRLSL